MDWPRVPRRRNKAESGKGAWVGGQIDLSRGSQAGFGKEESAGLPEFINIIMCCDLLSTKQQRHQRYFFFLPLVVVFSLTYQRKEGNFLSFWFLTIE